MLDGAGEIPIRKRIDVEAHVLADFHLPDVGLVHRQYDLHLAQVFGNLEQGRRLQTGGDGLPGLHRTRKHHTIDRRANHAALQIELRTADRRLLLRDLGTARRACRDCLIARGPRGIDVAARDQLALPELGLARVIRFGIAHAGLRLCELRLRGTHRTHRLLHFCIEGAGIDARDDLPFAHPIVVVDQHRLHHAGYLRAHIHGGDRTQTAGRGNRHRDCAAIDHGGAVVCRIALRTPVPPPAASRDHDRQPCDPDNAASGTPGRWGIAYGLRHRNIRLDKKRLIAKLHSGTRKDRGVIQGTGIAETASVQHPQKSIKYSQR